MVKGLKSILRIIITVAVLAIAGGTAYRFIASKVTPRETVSVRKESKVVSEPLSFYKGSDKISGKLYFLDADSLDVSLPTVICSSGTANSEFWCRSIPSRGGCAAFSFNYLSDKEKDRAAQLETVIKGIKGHKAVDGNNIWLLGEGFGCLTAANAAFDNPSKVKGLILVAPGFNPRDLSRKGKRYKGDILVLESGEPKSESLAKIRGMIIPDDED